MAQVNLFKYRKGKVQPKAFSLVFWHNPVSKGNKFFSSYYLFVFVRFYNELRTWCVDAKLWARSLQLTFINVVTTHMLRSDGLEKTNWFFCIDVCRQCLQCNCNAMATCLKHVNCFSTFSSVSTFDVSTFDVSTFDVSTFVIWRFDDFLFFQRHQSDHLRRSERGLQRNDERNIVHRSLLYRLEMQKMKQ
jgi:hypothetical protein